MVGIGVVLLMYRWQLEYFMIYRLRDECLFIFHYEIYLILKIGKNIEALRPILCD